MMSANRKLSRDRSGVYLEIVTGAVEAGRTETIFLGDYFLRLYASPNYLKNMGHLRRFQSFKTTDSCPTSNQHFGSRPVQPC